MKKFLSAILAFTMLISLTACQDTAPVSQDEQAQTSQTSQESEEGTDAEEPQEEEETQPTNRLEQIQQAGKIVLATSPDYPPMSLRI